MTSQPEASRPVPDQQMTDQQMAGAPLTGLTGIRLIATPPFGPDSAFEAGGLSLAPADPGRITAIAPFRGQTGAVTAALRDACGLGFPDPGRVLEGDGVRIAWSGRGQAFLFAADPAPLTGLAALVDQTDAWATLHLTGPDAAEVMARLVPIDLRPAAFGPGHSARAPLGHMMSMIIRIPDGLEVLVFRSMAQTARDEIAAAMRARVARAAG